MLPINIDIKIWPIGIEHWSLPTTISVTASKCWTTWSRVNGTISSKCLGTCPAQSDPRRAPACTAAFTFAVTIFNGTGRYYITNMSKINSPLRINWTSQKIGFSLSVCATAMFIIISQVSSPSMDKLSNPKIAFSLSESVTTWCSLFRMATAIDLQKHKNDADKCSIHST